ncbi:MAG: molybdopterin cofactor-binding domain-containing protein, partial [Vicinamibacterales bacterium]
MAKVTGRAKYAEDFRAEGMVFIKLMPSPRPHARVVSIDASAALAMPGVHGMITADDLPVPPPPPGGAAPPAKKAEAPPAKKAEGAAAGATAGVQGTPAPPGTPAAAPAPTPPAPPPMPAEFALTKEPVYEGEPILAIAADTEELASEAIDRIVVTFEPLPHVIDPLDSLRPGGPDGRTQGNIFVGPSMRTLKWTAADMELVDQGKFPNGAEAAETLTFGDVEAGFKEADLIVERDMQQQTTSHQPLESRSAMAYWQNGKCHLHVSSQSLARTVAAVAGWVGVKPEELVLI